MSRTHEADIGQGVFSSRDSADCELRYLLIAVEEISKDFPSFTAKQGQDLRDIRTAIDEMLTRVEQ